MTRLALRTLSAFIVGSFLFSALALFVPSATVHAAVSVKTVSIPAGSVAAGVVLSSDASTLYYVSLNYGAVYTVPTSTLSSYATVVANAAHTNDRTLFGTALDSSGNLWSTRRTASDCNPSPCTPTYADGVTRINTATWSVTDVLDGSFGAPNYQNEFDGIGYNAGYVYMASGTVLFKISTASPYSNTQYAINGGGGSYYGFVSDGSGNVWFTDILNGKLCKFDGTTVTCYSGFSRPLGLAVSGTTGYVAENNANGKIDTVNLLTGAITLQTTTTATPYDVKVILGSIVYSSSGSDHNICIVSGICIVTGEANFFLQGDASGNVYFSGLGSNVVGQVSGLLASPTTTTSSSTTTSTTGGGGGGGGGGGFVPVGILYMGLNCGSNPTVNQSDPCSITLDAQAYVLWGNTTITFTTYPVITSLSSTSAVAKISPNPCPMPFSANISEHTSTCSFSFTPFYSVTYNLTASYKPNPIAYQQSKTATLSLTASPASPPVVTTTTTSTTLTKTLTSTATSISTATSFQTQFITSSFTTTATSVSTSVSTATQTQPLTLTSISTLIQPTTETQTSTVTTTFTKPLVQELEQSPVLLVIIAVLAVILVSSGAVLDQRLRK